MNQLKIFASLDFAAKKKRTKRDVFLTEMAAVVPWGALEALIEPHYPKVGPQGGRRPFPLSTMLHIYCLQQWYNLSDPGAEEALYDIQSMRAFAGLELGCDAIPDETTILNFRHLLECLRPDEGDFRGRCRASRGEGRAAARRHHCGCDVDRGVTLDEEQRAAARSRDDVVVEGKPVVFRHEGAHWRRCGERLVHTAGVTTGKVHDAKVMVNLIREDDSAVYGDKGYASDEEARGGRRRRAVGREGKSEAGPRSHEAAARSTAASAKCARRSNTCFASSNASSAIARSAIAASPKTAHKCSRSSRSPISISRAVDLRPLEEKCGLNRAISTSRSRSNS